MKYCSALNINYFSLKRTILFGTCYRRKQAMRFYFNYALNYEPSCFFDFFVVALILYDLKSYLQSDRQNEGHFVDNSCHCLFSS